MAEHADVQTMFVVWAMHRSPWCDSPIGQVLEAVEHLNLFGSVRLDRFI